MICRVLAVLLLAAALPAAALTPIAAGAAQPILATVPLTLITTSGAHRFRVEIAATPAQQQAGLMFRTAMPPNAGMLFPFAPAQPATFWMENTVLPLDLIFIGPDRRVLNIAADAKPYARDFIASAGPVIAVLELNAGEAKRIGLQPGDAVTFKLR